MDLSTPPGRKPFAPLAYPTATYQHVRVACGESVVRSDFALFPHAAGYALVAYYPPTNAHLVFVDYAPKAKEVAEDLAAFVEAYWDDLNQARSEEELPRPFRNALQAPRKEAQQRLEKGRIRFTDFNGIYLPGCPGRCPPGTLAEAWSRLAAEERRAFAPLLGLLVRVGANPGPLIEKESFMLHGTETGWPEEFGDKPVGPLEGRLTSLSPGTLPFSTFARPDAAVARHLFGPENWEPPLLDGKLRDVIKAIRKAVTLARDAAQAPRDGWRNTGTEEERAAKAARWSRFPPDMSWAHGGLGGVCDLALAKGGIQTPMAVALKAPPMDLQLPTRACTQRFDVSQAGHLGRRAAHPGAALATTRLKGNAFRSAPKPQSGVGFLGLGPSLKPFAAAPGRRTCRPAA